MTYINTDNNTFVMEEYNDIFAEVNIVDNILHDEHDDHFYKIEEYQNFSSF